MPNVGACIFGSHKTTVWSFGLQDCWALSHVMLPRCAWRLGMSVRAGSLRALLVFSQEVVVAAGLVYGYR